MPATPATHGVVGVSGPLTAAFILLGSSSSLIVLLLLPLVIGAMETEFGFSPQQLGLLGSADLIGVAIATVAALWWQPLCRIRSAAVIAAELLAALNWITPFTNSFAALLALRCLVGVAGGVVVAIGMICLGARRDGNRIMAGVVATQVTLTILGFELLPAWIDRSGVAAVFILGGVLNAILALVSLGLPDSRPAVAPATTLGKPRWPVALLLASIVVFFAAQAGVWGFLEVWGRELGLAPTTVSRGLSIAALVSLVGPAYVFAVDHRHGCLKPLAAALAAQLAAMLAMRWIEPSAIAFTLAVSLFAIGWNVGISFQVSLLIKTDTTRQALVVYPTTYCLGYAAGPALVGACVGSLGLAALPYVGATLLLTYGATISIAVLLAIAARSLA